MRPAVDYAPPPPLPPRIYNAVNSDYNSSAPFFTSKQAISDGKQQGGWKGRLKGLGHAVHDVADKANDKLGAGANKLSGKVGSNSFWAINGDFPEEIKKCNSILRAFTIEGIEVDDPNTSSLRADKKTPKWKQQKKTMMRIPPGVIRQAQGIVIFTSMRAGIAPMGGANGNGLIIARLPDGSWSPPSGIMPFNLSGGFMFGIDIYDAVLILRTQKSVSAFSKLAKPTLGGELAVAAGPWGAGAAAESGLELKPVLSYVRSRGLYAGVELVGQVFVTRWEENARFYQWPKVRPEDILRGRVEMPLEAHSLIRTIQSAEGIPSSISSPVTNPFVDSPQREQQDFIVDSPALYHSGSLYAAPYEVEDEHFQEDVDSKEAIQRRIDQEERAFRKRSGTLTKPNPNDPMEHQF